MHNEDKEDFNGLASFLTSRMAFLATPAFQPPRPKLRKASGFIRTIEDTQVIPLPPLFGP
jgi:hypothetical protein